MWAKPAFRSHQKAVGTLALLLTGVSLPTVAGAEVLFQNTGNTMGWGRVFTQKAGTITEVSTPVYKGATSVKTTQTYQKSDGANYHSEIIKTKAHLAGQDLYYGHAVYLPADWVFHGQNVTFQQWAPEDPEGPWILMFLQGEKVRLGGRGANGDKDAGSVSGLRGTWIRFVTRIHMSENGAFEVWINGNKTFSQKGNFRSRGPSMRWSNGIYCTRWDTETPSGPRELTFWHDNMRIATTYAEADPASWGDGDPGPVATPPDAGAADAGEMPVVDAGGVGGAGGGGGGGASGSGGAAGASSGSGGGAGAGAGGATAMPGPSPASGGASGQTPSGKGGQGDKAAGGAASEPGGSVSTGCRFGASPGGNGGAWLGLLVLALFFPRGVRAARQKR